MRLNDLRTVQRAFEIPRLVPRSAALMMQLPLVLESLHPIRFHRLLEDLPHLAARASLGDEHCVYSHHAVVPPAQLRRQIPEVHQPRRGTDQSSPSTTTHHHRVPGHLLGRGNRMPELPNPVVRRHQKYDRRDSFGEQMLRQPPRNLIFRFPQLDRSTDLRQRSPRVPPKRPISLDLPLGQHVAKPLERIP